MDLVTSRLTSKYQATVPASIREKLHLEAGDRLAFEVMESGEVCLRKATPVDLGFAGAVGETLKAEWLSENDEAAYGDL